MLFNIVTTALDEVIDGILIKFEDNTKLRGVTDIFDDRVGMQKDPNWLE